MFDRRCARKLSHQYNLQPLLRRDVEADRRDPGLLARAIPQRWDLHDDGGASRSKVAGAQDSAVLWCK
jgi:hypothetical protein